LEIKWHFARAFHRHLTCPIPILYVSVKIFFAKHNVIAFLVIFEPTTGFVSCGPKICSKPFYCPRAEIEILLHSPLDVVFFKEKY
jgi:hypothetical protein